MKFWTAADGVSPLFHIMQFCPHCGYGRINGTKPEDDTCDACGRLTGRMKVAAARVLNLRKIGSTLTLEVRQGDRIERCPVTRCASRPPQ